MTAKEKAIDLVRDMEFEIPYIHDPTEPQGDDIAKQCALIAVKELIRETGSKYWYDVKQEIENL
jgi:hypothetical protein